MENNREYHIGRTDFDAFVHAVGSEIEQAQVPADYRSQCANAVPLLENGQLYPVSSELARLGKQNHQATGKGYPFQLS